VHGGGLSQQGVVFCVRLGGQSVAVVLGGYDSFELSARVQDCPCENLIGSVGEATYSDEAAEHVRREQRMLGVACMVDRGAVTRSC